MPEQKGEGWSEVAEEVVGKASKKEINFTVKLLAIGVFFVLIAVA